MIQSLFLAVRRAKENLILRSIDGGLGEVYLKSGKKHFI